MHHKDSLKLTEHGVKEILSFEQRQENVKKNQKEHRLDLIRSKEGYYVPWDARYYTDTGGKIVEEFEDDVNLTFPSVMYDTAVNKYKVSILSPDFGGYDVCVLNIWFDSIYEFLELMGIRVKPNSVEVRKHGRSKTVLSGD